MEEMLQGLNRLDDQWAPLQAKVFTRWVQNNLKGVKDAAEVNDVRTDLTNGVALVELAEILTGKKASINWVHDPKRNVDEVQNCDLALRMFTNDGCRFVNMSGKDIHDGNQNLTLGLIWTLILHYQLRKAVADNEGVKEGNSVENKGALPPLPAGAQVSSNKKNKEKLYSWAGNRTASYSNLSSYKRYDLSMCALLDSYVPEKINYSSLNLNDSQAELATKTMEELGIPVYVYPEDLQETDNKVDEKTLVTQLSAAKIVLDRLSSAKLAEPTGEVEKKENIADQPMGLTDTFKTPADSQQASAEAVPPAEQQGNLVSDHPMGLTDTFKTPVDSQQASTEAVAPAEKPHKMESEHPMHLSDVFSQHNLVSDHPMGLTDTFKTPDDSQQVSEEAVAPVEKPHKMESEHPMHLSDVFSQHNLVSDNPMNLTDVFGVTSEPPEPLADEPMKEHKEMVSDHPMHLSDVFYSKSTVIHKKCVVDTFTTPARRLVHTEFHPIIKIGHHHHHVHQNTMNNEGN